jgi:putative flippase GtrA
MAKFSLVGVVNTTIDVTLFGFFVHFLHWNVLPANMVSYSTGILNSFVMNKLWTFQDQTPFAHSLQPFVLFVVINISSLFLSTAVVWLLAQHFPELVAKFLSVGVVFLWNYTLSRLLVFSAPTQ